jgi:hypothetical protein
MTTATQIIQHALGLISIKDPSEAIGGTEAANCLARLNTLLDSWRTESLAAYSLARVSASLSSATATVGPAGTFITASRPVRLELGCFFSAGGVDYPIQPIGAEQYNAIPVKSVGSLGPSVVYLDEAWPTATAYFYPTPAAAVTVTLLVQTQITAFADLTTDYSLPPGYARALAHDLALEMAPEYMVNITPGLMQRASAAKRSITRVNSRAPVLYLPSIIGQRRYDSWRF